MPKSKEKFPRVFLACPYDGKMKNLINELNLLPWTIKSANDQIKSDDLLTKIIENIKECDFAIFDITGWNANVCLELGLAKGIGKDYYILNNNAIRKDVPSDIKGSVRIDYNWNKKKNAASLFGQLKDGVFKEKYLTSKVWKNIQHSSRADDKFILVIYILSEVKGAKRTISMSEIKRLAKGLNFKKQEDFKEVVDSLTALKIFKKIQKSGNLTLCKTIYK